MRLILTGLFLFSALGLSAQAQFVDLSRMNTGVMSHDEWATQVLSTPSGKEIISAGVDGRVVFWDAATGKVRREISLPAIVLTLSLSNDGLTLAAGDASGTVSLIDTLAGEIKSTFAADKKMVNATTWSEDGKFVAAGGPEGVVRVWAADDRKITKEITPAQANISALAFTGSRLVIGLVDGTNEKRSAEVWDWQNSKLIRTYDEGAAGLRAISVSPDGKLLAIADFQKATLLNIVPTEGNGAEVSFRVLPDPDTATIVAIWDLTTGKRVALVEAETGARSIAFSPDGQMLASAGVNGAMLFDVGHGLYTEIGRLDSMLSIDSVAFAPDSKQLVIARELEPLVKFGNGGIDKIVDPVFTSMILEVREGVNFGTLIPPEVGKPLTQTSVKPTPKGALSLTGGSNIEVWRITRRTTEPDTKTFEAIRILFDGKSEDARKMLRQVIKDYPNYGEAQRIYAIFFESQDIIKLQRLIEASVKADPACVSCWRSLGDIQFKAEHPTDTIKSYEQVLKLRPEYGLVAGHQADAYAAVGLELSMSENTAKNMDAAKEVLTRALMLRPAVEQFYTNLGAAYYFRGDFDMDISLLTIARKLRPDHARIFYNLGHAYRYKGDKQKAIEAYSRYVRMGEKGEEARVEKAKEFIKELSK